MLEIWSCKNPNCGVKFLNPIWSEMTLLHCSSCESTNLALISEEDKKSELFECKNSNCGSYTSDPLKIVHIIPCCPLCKSYDVEKIPISKKTIVKCNNPKCKRITGRLYHTTNSPILVCDKCKNTDLQIK